jgi:putative peptidoglycan lipid II flippase
MLQKHQALKSVIAILFFTLLSKVMGFFRELTIAAKFGLGKDTDTFFMAIATISMISNIIIVSLNTTFIPVLTEVEVREGKEGKNKHASNALSITLLASLILLIIVEVSAPILVRFVAPGFVGEQMLQFIWYLRVGIPVIFVSATMGITRGYLQSEMRFFDTAISNVAFNIVYLTYLLLLSSNFDIKFLIFVHILAIISQLILQIRPLHNVGFKYSPAIDFQDHYIRKMGILIIPVLMGVAVQDLNFIVDKSLASILEIGSISALNYSVRINTLVQIVFVSAITTVLFPMLTKAFSYNERKTQINLIRKGFISIIMIAFPAMIAILLLNEQIIQVAFMRGRFDKIAVKMTAGALYYYAFGLVPMALRVFFDKVYYSIQDTKTPLYTGIVTLVSNVLSSLILMRFMFYKGLALGTSISVSITIGFMIHRLTKKSLAFMDRNTLIKTTKVIAASLVMGGAVLAIRHLGVENMVNNMLLVLLIYAIVGVLTYFVTIKLLRVEELDWFLKSIFEYAKKGKDKPTSTERN